MSLFTVGKQISYALEGSLLYKNDVSFPVHHDHLCRLVAPLPLGPPGSLLFVRVAAAAVLLLEAARPDV